MMMIPGSPVNARSLLTRSLTGTGRCQVCVRTPNCTLSGFPLLRSRGVYLTEEQQQEQASGWHESRETHISSFLFSQKGVFSRGRATQWIGDEKDYEGGRCNRCWENAVDAGEAMLFRWISKIRKTCSLMRISELGFINANIFFRI